MDFSIGAKWQIVLGDLVIFGHVRIEVVFAVEFAEFGNGASGEQTGFDRGVDRLFIGDGQDAGIAHADGADVGVGFGTEFIGTGAEHFAGTANLGVYFQTDYSFVFHDLQNNLMLMFFA